MSQQDFQLNVFGPEFRENPYPFFQQMRKDNPVYWSEETKHWMLTRYPDVSRALKTPKEFSSDSSKAFVFNEELHKTFAPLLKTFSMLMVMRDNPDHQRLRGLINKTFAPDTLKTVPARSQEVAEMLIDNAVKKGSIEVMADFAYPLPTIVFADILGVEEEDHLKFRTWSKDMGLVAGRTGDMDAMLKGQQSLIEISKFFEDLVQERLKHPKDDFVSEIAEVWKSEGKLTLDELVAQLVMLLAGGHTTTQNVIGIGALSLFKSPEQLENLKSMRNDKVLLGRAVEEIFRYTSPATAPARIVAEDMELHGQQLKAGQGVMPMISSANRDPEVFENAELLDLSREHNPHIAFGEGSHKCPGTFLARMEVPIAFETLFRRLPNLQAVSEKEDWSENLSFRGLNTLHATF